MKPLIETTNVTINNIFNVTTGHSSVIQKGNVTKSNIYGLQLWDNGKNIRVYRGPKSSSSTLNKLIFNGTSLAGGHTQTWEFSVMDLDLYLLHLLSLDHFLNIQ